MGREKAVRKEGLVPNRVNLAVKRRKKRRTLVLHALKTG